MATTEGEDATEEEFHGPPPPPRGTAAYEEMVLRICAIEGFDAFHERVRGPWEHIGWRLGLDIMTETLFQFARSWSGEPSMRDAFGNLKLPEFMQPFDEENKLRYAAAASRSAKAADLPSHEAFKDAMAAGDEIREFMEGLIPACQNALNDIVRTGRKEGASAILLRFLNTQPDRLTATERATSLLQACLRTVSMPRGEGWVGPHLLERRGVDPDLLHGSLAVEDRLDEMAEWNAPRMMPLAVKGKDPLCTCGLH